MSRKCIILGSLLAGIIYFLHRLLMPDLWAISDLSLLKTFENVKAWQEISFFMGTAEITKGKDEHAKSRMFMYRGAPWKSHIGSWLSTCDAINSAVPVIETIHGKTCTNNCNNRGVCNHEFGRCSCRHGYAGVSCEEVKNFECNKPASEGAPYPWIVSMCPAYCDKRRAMCFCGDGSKYPDRPVANDCGFLIYENGSVDLSKDHFSVIYANQSEKTGWCNVDPSDFYGGKIKIKPQCHCQYDCTWGSLCETPVECTCINQCSGKGECTKGFCQCQEGWFGIDCSIPSTTSLTDKLHQDRFANMSIEHGPESSHLVTPKRRPLIYIYELPPEYNNHLIEGRHYRGSCVNRGYDANNATIWSGQLYGAEIALYEGLLSSPYRTTNGNEADFFYVPVLGACAIARADDAPHFSMQMDMHFRSYFSGDIYKQAYMYIRIHYPFWNQSGGHDHLWFFGWDEGACAAPKEIWNSTMLVHWGNTNSKHKSSTTAYFADSWDLIPKEWRGSHPCYDFAKDIVLPAWKAPNQKTISDKLWARPRENRTILFYFNGNLGSAYGGRPEPSYSMGLRQKLAHEFGSSPNKEGRIGRQASPDVIVTNIGTATYAVELSKSRFCGVLPGDGWSGRMEDSILHGCIPVIIQDGIHLPYENFLDYDSFTVRVLEDNLTSMVSILRNITEAQVDAKLKVIHGLWQRFVYRDALMLEAQRQERYWKHKADWAEQYESLTADDVFATLLQILHYKLHNDKWRLPNVNVKRYPCSTQIGRSIDNSEIKMQRVMKTEV